MMTHGWTLRKLAVLRANSAEREWGFTLMEVMVTLMVLSVGLLGIASQSVSVIKANSLSDQMTRATVLAKDKMEELKRLGYTHTQLQDTDSYTADVSTDIQTNPSFFTNPDHSDTNPTSETGTVTLTSAPKRVWNVADRNLEVPPVPGMKTVTVIVGWKTANKAGTSAKSHYVALTTIIHEYQ
jgi:type IV pilus assembly protein PilV